MAIVRLSLLMLPMGIWRIGDGYCAIELTDVTHGDMEDW